MCVSMSPNVSGAGAVRARSRMSRQSCAAAAVYATVSPRRSMESVRPVARSTCSTRRNNCSTAAHDSALHEMGSTESYAAVEQLLRLVEQVERATGLTLSMDRLGATVAYTAAAAQLWRDILDLACTAPAPLTFGDMLTHMTPMVVLRGTPEAVAYYELLKSEVEDRVASGIAAVPDERQRFYWDGPPIWS